MPATRDLAAIRRVLRETGHSAVTVDATFERQLFLRHPTRGAVGTLYEHEDGTWLVCVGARATGGFRASITGAPGERVGTVLRRAIAATANALEPARNRDAELADEVNDRVARALRVLVGRRRDPELSALRAVDARGRRFRWLPLCAVETRRELRRAFDDAQRAVRRITEKRGRSSVRRTLRACVWRHRAGSVAIWETDHDLGHGLQVQIGWWTTPTRAALPPW